MLLWLAAHLWLATPAPSYDQADTGKRYAIIIGANMGNPDEGALQFATADARNVANTLESVAGFSRERMVVLSNPSTSDVRSQFKRMKWLMQAEPTGEKLLFVYYSGHADVFSIHLAGGQISWLDLTTLTNNTDANTRILIVDACRSGELTQVKGNVVTQPFALPTRSAGLAQGIAVITSASAGELAQESPSFRGSFFTHHFLAALRGAGDQNGDGQVTLEEAFNYSSAQALFDTGKTVTGAQHATYRIKMRGRGSLTLGYPKSSKGLATLHISDAGDYLLRGGKNNAAYVMELHVPERSERSVWLAAGDYDVQWRTADGVYVGALELPAGKFSRLKVSALSRQHSELYALKGGGQGGPAAEPALRLRLFGSGGTALLSGQNLPWGGGLTLPVRLHGRVWFDVLAEVLVASGVSGPWNVQQLNLDALAGLGLTLVEQSIVGLYIGMRTGATLLMQQYDGEPSLASRRQVASITEAFASLDILLHDPVLLTLELGPRLAYLNVVQSNGQNRHRAEISGWLRLGITGSF